MKLEILTDEDFMKFVENHNLNNFFQTTMMRDKLLKDNKEVYLLGLKDNNQIVAASLVATTGRTFLKKKEYEAYKGFILDYDNTEILKEMTQKTINFLKDKNAYRLVIDPYITNVSRDSDANIIDGIDNRHIKDDLYKLGYKENAGNQVKWCYALDIDGKSSEELFNSFRPTVRNSINRTINKYALNIRYLKKEELSEFKEITSSTCERRHFLDKPLKYYEDMYESFMDDVRFEICELDCDKYLNNLKIEQKDLLNRLNNISNHPSNEKKIKELNNNLELNKKNINNVETLKKENGNIIPLSCAMFMLYGKEAVYLFSGSYEKYMNYFGQYLLQWDIIKYCADNKYKKYNFYGIQDVFDSKGPDRGVYEFKKGFNGYVDELLGSFEISVTFHNKIYRILKCIKKLLKK